MILAGKNGVTLIELMVVMAIVGLLAAVAIPKYGDLLEKANLGATLGNLGSLRSACSIYYANYMQIPNSIDPAVEPEFGKVLHETVPFVKARHPSSNSPYGNEVSTSSVSGAMPAGMLTGWFYNSTDGAIYINSVALDIKGNPYTMY